MQGAEIIQMDALNGPAGAVLLFLVYIVLGLAPASGIAYLIYFLITLPMRRRHRARMFLDALESGLRDGHSPEATIVRLAASRDPSLGARFHLLAAHLEQGARLTEALQRVPRLLPPQVTAMLATAERIGDFQKVLPACRRLLEDGVSQVRGALNYLLLLIFAITPAIILIPWTFRVKVLPTYEMVFAEAMRLPSLPPFSRLVFGATGWIVLAQAGLFTVLWALALAYLGGPRLRSWLRINSLIDRLQFRLPWRRMRLQRDFTGMLAVLLDAGVPEKEAVSMAAECTRNSLLISRAAEVARQLGQGVPIAEALCQMDQAGQLRWRLSNVLKTGNRGFARALAGWQEALDARAFQLEQAAAQVASTAMVLFNGLVVGCLVIATFLLIVALINEGVLW